MTDHPVRSPGHLTMHGSAALALAAFRSFPFGIVVFDYDGRIVIWNRCAEQLVGHLATDMTCCELLGCRTPGGVLADGCITALVRSRQEALPEVRVDVETDDGPGAVWVASAPLAPAHEHVVVQLRPGETGDRRRRTVPHWVAGPQLRIHTLGRTTVESAEGPIGGRWLERRSGDLLKLLVVERSRVVHSDEIIESLWPGSDVRESNHLRFLVHSLRQKIEPRRKRGKSSFILARNGGSTLDRERVWVDADEFERLVGAGQTALAGGNVAEAESLLTEAIDLYGGPFLVDAPYEIWAQAERDRLRALMSDALTAMAGIRRDAGDLDSAAALTERLAEIQPYDMDIQRDAVQLMLRCGRRSDAVRHYQALRKRMREMFDEEPLFKLADLSTDS